jgi:hypothetical protein
MEGLRIVGGGEFLDRGRFDASLPGPVRLADGEVLEVQRARGQPRYPGSLAASTSTFSIVGGWASSSGAFAISAAATLPDR